MVNTTKDVGSPEWWVVRLGQRLMDRADIYKKREDYASGNHPLPNGDRRYVKALRELQEKAKTNYIALTQQAIVKKIRPPKGFRFGDDNFSDEESAEIFSYNDMDIQSKRIIQTASELGFSYAVVLSPEDGETYPRIAYRDPRMCEIEYEVDRPTVEKAGLELWEDPSADVAYAILYLRGDGTYRFAAETQEFRSDRRHRSINWDSLRLVSYDPDEIGEIPLIRCDWDPAYGDIGKATGEEAWPIQDRINKTILDRLVITNSQAYRQRWVKGAPEPKKGSNAPPWDPGADMLWISTSPDTEFGDFQQADIKQLLEAIQDDIGDMAAITQTPATSLVNRMVNISGDTVVQINSGHTARVRNHQDAVGFFFEKLLKRAFMYMGSTKADDLSAEAIWWPIEVRSFAEIADAFQKLVASGIPLQLAMEFAGVFTDAQIKYAVAEAEKRKAEEKADAQEQLKIQMALKADQPSGQPQSSNKP